MAAPREEGLCLIMCPWLKHVKLLVCESVPDKLGELSLSVKVKE